MRAAASTWSATCCCCCWLAEAEAEATASCAARQSACCLSARPAARSSARCRHSRTVARSGQLGSARRRLANAKQQRPAAAAAAAAAARTLHALRPQLQLTRPAGPLFCLPANCARRAPRQPVARSQEAIGECVTLRAAADAQVLRAAARPAGRDSGRAGPGSKLATRRGRRPAESASLLRRRRRRQHNKCAARAHERPASQLEAQRTIMDFALECALSGRATGVLRARRPLLRAPPAQRQQRTPLLESAILGRSRSRRRRFRLPSAGPKERVAREGAPKRATTAGLSAR